MYRKKPEEIITEETKVWICTSDSCKGWVRDNFKSSESEIPVCPLCKSEMKSSTKELEVINNHKKY
ncbi:MULTISPECIES: cold-inducible protein YdjO-related protein [Metabacillus]|uniref:Cold-shock protein n=1 Tax=Metabacillus indicus TaxID=246786 RepID=A0A084H4M9_METID|nr:MULTISPECIES: cold-inducible protein YdjO-related protein [Metabacillus]KEZ50383.1 cold-shock protein [Metabacillus indicus LMG 22858]KEZ54541.1 cold-shock protein [Metabacillus indicus]MDX8291690.1 cold-inducible protein YdjO-related protein [Metabacillus indicus]